MTGPRMIDVASPAQPDGVVLVMHGGASRPRSPMVSPTQLSVLRMIPIARRVARAGRGRLAVVRLLNTSRGWDAHHTPVDDAQWALDQLADRYGPDVPVGLVGHSLGGRAALLSAHHVGVRSVVALNPWLYPSDGRRDLSGRQVLIVHGDADRVADPANAAEVANDLCRSTSASLVWVRGAKHAMLRRHDVFSGLAAEFTRAVLLRVEPGSPTVRDVLRGHARVEV